MKLSSNATIQILGTALSALTAISEAVPARAKVWVIVGASAIQAVISVLSHFSNPDGTPAQVAYLPGRK